MLVFIFFNEMLPGIFALEQFNIQKFDNLKFMAEK